MEGCHPEILKRLTETNFEQSVGYCEDHYCQQASELIRKECGIENANVWFMVGGTQTNATVIDSMLMSHQGVISADSGHIAVHEAGAIEAWGHKVITLPSYEGKIKAAEIADYVDSFYADATYPHMVFPGLLYLSYPTEYGTLYTKGELTEIRAVCNQRNIPIFIDGARMGYGLMSPEADMDMKDIAKLCDIFYIGGTKIGALFGEAVVATSPDILPHFFTNIKRHGALLAKGRLLGLQFCTLFENGLYYQISKHAVEQAIRIRNAFTDKGYKCAVNSSTNQQFIMLPNHIIDALSAEMTFEIWGARGDNESIVRFVTSWATRTEHVDRLIEIINNI